MVCCKNYIKTDNQYINCFYKINYEGWKSKKIFLTDFDKNQKDYHIYYLDDINSYHYSCPKKDCNDDFRVDMQLNNVIIYGYFEFD